MSKYIMVFSVYSGNNIYRGIDFIEYSSDRIPFCFRDNNTGYFSDYNKKYCYVRINDKIYDTSFCPPRKLIREIKSSNPELVEIIKSFVQYCKTMKYTPRIFCFPEKVLTDDHSDKYFSPLRSF